MPGRRLPYIASGALQAPPRSFPRRRRNAGRNPGGGLDRTSRPSCIPYSLECSCSSLRRTFPRTFSRAASTLLLSPRTVSANGCIPYRQSARIQGRRGSFCGTLRRPGAALRAGSRRAALRHVVGGERARPSHPGLRQPMERRRSLVWISLRPSKTATRLASASRRIRRANGRSLSSHWISRVSF